MDRYVVFTDVSKRDGIGIEFYVNDVLALEIFRNDATKTKTISLYHEDFPLDKLKAYIAIFDKEIPSDFMSD